MTIKKYLVEHGFKLLKTESNGTAVFLYDPNFQYYDAMDSDEFVVSEILSF